MSLNANIQEPWKSSRRNRLGLSSLAAEAIALVSDYVESMDARRNRRFNDAQRDECQANVMCLLMDLLSVSSVSDELWIGYSRGKANYLRGGSYFDHYRGCSLLSYTYYLDAIDLLTELELVENVNAKAGFSTFSSRLRPTEKMRQIFQKLNLDWTCITEKSDVANIIVKDDSKAVVTWPEPGQFDLQRAIENLARINDNLSRTFININISDDELFELNRSRVANTLDEGFDAEDLTGRQPIDFSHRTIRRIFAMNSFSNAGRFYGGWWQGVPSSLRKHIQIDGAVTVELDYSTMQPRILYASVGLVPPKDSYLIPGWENVPRKTVKKLFSQLLNSDESSRNPNQWHRFAPSEDPDLLPDNWSELDRAAKDKYRRRHFSERTGKDYSELIRDVLKFHAPIEKDFFSSVWGATQHIDAQIAELTMLKMLDQPVPTTVLPIHDSFIVRRGGEEALRTTMIEAFDEVVEADIKIDRDEAVFDRPEGNEGKEEGILLSGSELHAQVRTMLDTHKGYFSRERQWEVRWGPID